MYDTGWGEGHHIMYDHRVVGIMYDIMYDNGWGGGHHV